jgi:hypothetical protein
MRKLIIGIFILFSLTALTANAARNFPPNAIAGKLVAHEYPYVQIDSDTLHLAPGSKIFDQNNRIILPNYLPDNASVVYQLGVNGELSNMWLLTDEEDALVKQTPQ